jgi:D-inositol-3-phosphate glycosyltransferase
VLVDGHDPGVWAKVLAELLASPGRLASLSRGAREHASGFGWPTTADRLLGVYVDAMNLVRYDAALSEREVKRCFLPA